ncbi:ribosome hibernation-promoting factor, HPF/YfiA family [Roseobacter sp. HKCCA0434]|uniref:ribosome hibernation-promoting factor, HPF/YfiA family n=1 Tax=Roseobacter sp. HKCCA0434 TaxID=3079297 RepID=UPI002905F2D5|nr:ribosome-associated translation inhibitor RaiA [Roseobacter sp. HKCCA0434]
MRIQVTGKHIDIGDALRGHVSDRIEELAGKYAGRATEAVVTLSKDAHEYKCDATVHLSTGMTTQASARAHEIYGAFDSTADKMEKQLRRYKRRLKDHHKDRQDPIEMIGAPSYVIANPDFAEDNEPEDLQPVIVAETKTPVMTLSVGEAVMQMELMERNFLVFRNTSHGGVNVVYSRDDGNVGWIDPRTMS